MDERQALADALARTGIDAVPVVMPTPWEVGDVTAYLFPGDPVTLIDAGVDTPPAREAVVAALSAAGREPADVARILVTHAHLDHYGGAVWLQEASGCQVLVHEDDLAMATNPDWRETERAIFPALGFTAEEVEQFFEGGDHDWPTPTFTPLADGEAFAAGSSTLRAEHHPGHTPGHVWICDEASGALFTGDYLIANHPTNAGLERDPSHPSGRAQLLEAYNRGLRELEQRDAPVLFPSHGPPITDHRALLARRLAKTERRTRSVLEALREAGTTTAVALGRRMYRDRMNTNWEVVADLAGRLDVLVAGGHATAVMGEDGVWYFTAR